MGDKGERRREPVPIQGGPNSLWRPIDPEGQAIEEQWKRAVGFRFSELGLTNHEVDIYLNPFRFPEEKIMFDVALANGVIQPPRSPLTPEELRTLPPETVVKLQVRRLGGQNGFRRYVREQVAFFENFRTGVDRLAKDEERWAIQDGLLTAEELKTLSPEEIVKLLEQRKSEKPL